METPEVAVGDILLCMDDSDSRNLRCHCEYRVVDINGHGNVKVEKRFDIGGEFLPPFEHYYKPDRFKLVEANKANVVPQVKVGDKIRMLKNSPWWKKGDEAVVSELEEGESVRAQFRDGSLSLFVFANDCKDKEYLSAGSFEVIEPATKPPLGVMPKNMWKEKRCQDLVRAIHEYYEAGKSPDAAWLCELSDLCRELA
jgi:hypothetical protein